jgi:uncharacterized protein
MPVLFLLMLSAAVLMPLPASGERPQELKPQGYANDFAGVLSPEARTKLTVLCSELDQKAHAQIAIVTIHTLEGDSIEHFSITMAQKWGVGPKSDRGVLILLVVNDRQYRAEVGYGLEEILPDGKVGSFQREAIPLIRSGNYNQALLLVTSRVADVIASDAGVQLSGPRPPPQPVRQPSGGISIGGIILLIIIVLIVLFTPLRSLLFWMLFSSMFDGRGGYGGGGGFGGFGGGGGGGGGGFGGFGGGSSGGGGASSSW